MYPEEMIRPMREELTTIGFREMRTPEEVDAILAQERRTVLVVVNSICGCAAGKARPALAKALSRQTRPELLTTVFLARIAKPRTAREIISPSMAPLPLPSHCFATARWPSCWRGSTSRDATLIPSPKI